MYINIGLVSIDQGINILKFFRLNQFLNKVIFAYMITIDFHNLVIKFSIN
jgi:hypothetical protein